MGNSGGIFVSGEEVKKTWPSCSWGSSGKTEKGRRKTCEIGLWFRLYFNISTLDALCCHNRHV